MGDSRLIKNPNQHMFYPRNESFWNFAILACLNLKMFAHNLFDLLLMLDDLTGLIGGTFWQNFVIDLVVNTTKFHEFSVVCVILMVTNFDGQIARRHELRIWFAAIFCGRCDRWDPPVETRFHLCPFSPTFPKHRLSAYYGKNRCLCVFGKPFIIF